MGSFFIIIICCVIILIRPFLVITKMSSRFRALSAQVRRASGLSKEHSKKRTRWRSLQGAVINLIIPKRQKSRKWKEALDDIQQPTRRTRLAQVLRVCASVCRVFTLIVLPDQSVTSPTPCGSKRDRYITTDFLGFYYFLFGLTKYKGKLIPPPFQHYTTCLPHSFKIMKP
jgi:hypothetical protein